MPSDMPRLTVRMEQEAIDKLREIAKNNERSLNQEIAYCLKKRIEIYEKENGKIKSKSSDLKIG